MKKKLTLAVALVLVMTLSVAGTLAYLTYTTDAVENTFTVGNVKITLAETTTDYKMVPGTEIAKNPTVTVDGSSEDCWLFVKIEENGGNVTLADKTTTGNFDSFITYAVAAGWTELTENPGVYYRQVNAKDLTKTFSVLANDKVTVNSSVTQDMMNQITADPAKAPTLTFTAYAIQLAGFEDNAAGAWAELNK